MTDWLRTEIITGLQKLLALRLPGSPADDTSKATAAVWIEAITTRPIAWDEKLDRLRVRNAFSRLIESCDRWPAPAEFFRQLQPRAYAQPALTCKLSDDARAYNKRKIKHIVNQFTKQHKPQ